MIQKIKNIETSSQGNKPKELQKLEKNDKKKKNIREPKRQNRTKRQNITEDSEKRYA